MPAHIDYSSIPIIFYKFVCEDINILSSYVGQTTNFPQRRRQHKHSCNNIENRAYNFKIYKTIRDNGGWTNWKMIEIERRICLDKSDAGRIEQEYIEKLQTNMNTLNTTFDREVWYLNNKESINEHIKKYRLKNPEKYTYRTTRYDCECGGKYNYNHKSRHLKTFKHQKYCETILPSVAV